MSIFIKKDDRVSVSIDGGVNVIWIKRKMDVGTSNRVQDALFSVMGLDEKGGYQSVSINSGRKLTLLLQNNIVAWEGPLFRDEDTGNPVPCTSQAIETLDPHDPLVEAVLEEVGLRNAKPEVVEAGKTVAPLSSTTASSKNGKKD